MVGYLAARVIPGEGSDFILRDPTLKDSPDLQRGDQDPGSNRMVSERSRPPLHPGNTILFILHQTKMLTLLERVATPLIVHFLGLPAKVTESFIIGFLRRDYGAAGLFMLAKQGILGPHQILVSLVTITLFIPCIAQFFMMIKERGLRKAV